MITKGVASTSMLYSNLAPDTDWKSSRSERKRERKPLIGPKSLPKRTEQKKESENGKPLIGPKNLPSKNKNNNKLKEKLKVEPQRKLETFHAQRKRVGSKALLRTK
jgi:hypothetical protein